MRTQAEIEAEIKALQACKGYVPHFTAFGEDNRAYLSTQIDALNGAIDETAAEFEELTERERDAYQEAIDWKNGDSDDVPSAGWDNYKNKAKK